MGTVQGAINTIIASTAAAATAIGKTAKNPAEPQEPKSNNPTKPSNDSIGNKMSQDAINKRYQQDKDFAARMDKAKANTAKRAQQMKDANKQEFDRLKLEKKKTEGIKKLTELKKHTEGGDK